MCSSRTTCELENYLLSHPKITKFSSRGSAPARTPHFTFCENLPFGAPRTLPAQGPEGTHEGTHSTDSSQHSSKEGKGATPGSDVKMPGPTKCGLDARHIFTYNQALMNFWALSGGDAMSSSPHGPTSSQADRTHHTQHARAHTRDAHTHTHTHARTHARTHVVPCEREPR